MGSLLSAISGQFAKLIILGTLFPVVIMSTLNVLLVAPLLPQTASLPGLLSKIAVGEEKWPAVVLSFVVFVLTGLLYDLNNPIIRMYEGYTWQNSLIGRVFCRLERSRFRKVASLAAATRSMRVEVAQANISGSELGDLRGQETALALYMNAELPDTEDLLLPTRLGNVIRCFERYPFLAYGMDVIVLWPRLVSKIDSGFASTIDETKTAFDFMLNLSFLSGITFLGVLAIGLAIPAPLERIYVLPWLWRASFFFVLTVIFYSFSINRALAWGVQVRAAFDLYRLDLLKGLGYQQKPLTYQEERALWFKISTEIAYANDRVAPLAYDEPSTRVIPYPTDVKVVVQRGRDQGANLKIPCEVDLQNSDAVRPVSSLTVIDSIPDGYKYVVDSASVSAGGLVVRRLAPLELFSVRFRLAAPSRFPTL